MTSVVIQTEFRLRMKRTSEVIFEKFHSMVLLFGNVDGDHSPVGFARDVKDDVSWQRTLHCEHAD